MKPNNGRNNGNNGNNGSTLLSDQFPVFKNTPKEPEDELMVLFSEMDKLDDEISITVKERTKELNDTIARKDKFFSDLAHDLRSPFSAIMLSFELLKTKLDHYNKTDFERYINMAANSANNSLRLLDNLLAWTTSQTNGTHFIPVEINLHNLILDEIAQFKTSALEKQIELKHSIASNLSVTANFQKVKTLLKDLISIAIKYSTTNGIINITASEKSQFIEIAIEENGKGVSFDAQKNLFKIDSFCSTESINQ